VSLGDFDDSEASVSMIDVDIGSKLKKNKTNVESNFHYRRSYYDVAFAISITDEILALDPLEDKLCVLKRKYNWTSYEIIDVIKQRISFFAIFNLFDTVEHNQIDN
jgi:hypothetical protein